MAGTVKTSLKDGVYLHLGEDEYFDQDALGSTDLTALWAIREGWWWKSRYNPRRKRTETSAMTFGKALHARLLEGKQAFDARYAVEPDPRDYPEPLKTSDDIIAALAYADAPKPSTKARKSDLVEMAEMYLPGRHIWDVIVAKARAAAGERALISADDAWEIELMTDLAMAQTDLAAVVGSQDAVRLSEVSVLWTLPDSTRMRFRFDSIVPDGNVDLKTVGNARGDFRRAVAERIEGDHLQVQLAQSFEARKVAYQFIKLGRIYGGSKEERAWLRRFPKEAPLNAGAGPGWAWLWIFYQRPDSNAGRAPTLLPVRVLYGEKAHQDGFRKAATGLARFREYRALFGMNEPWTRIMPVHGLNGAGGPQLETPPWGEAPMRVEGEEEALAWK